MWCSVANANLFNLNTYAYCYSKNKMWLNVKQYFSYIAFDNNYIRFQYSPYEKKFLIKYSYTGKKILKTNLKSTKGKLLYKIQFNKETGNFIVKDVIYSRTYIADCKKIKKRELPKSKF